MRKSKPKIYVRKQLNGNGQHLLQGHGDSRRVYQVPLRSACEEPAPHAAGTFHDPEQHFKLMQRFEAFLERQKDCKTAQLHDITEVDRDVFNPNDANGLFESSSASCQ